MDLVKLNAPSSEEEITKHWKYNDKVFVSVICTTYNQESYIRDAIESFLAQKTEYRFEIIIHDDASTDGTASIVREYKDKYPNVIRAIFQTVNQYSQGKKITPLAYKETKGDYLAICEGDDYWCNEYKLQKQFTELKKNKHINLSFHCAYQIDQTNNEKIILGKYRSQNGIVSVADIILKAKGGIPTASTMIKREAYESVLDTRNKMSPTTVGDIYLHIIGSMPSGALYIDSPMSVYRANALNSWSVRTYRNESKVSHHLDSVVRSFIELKQFYEEYSAAFNQAIEQRIQNFLLSPYELTLKETCLEKYKNLLPISKFFLYRAIIRNYKLYLNIRPYAKGVYDHLSSLKIKLN